MALDTSEGFFTYDEVTDAIRKVSDDLLATNLSISPSGFATRLRALLLILLRDRVELDKLTRFNRLAIGKSFLDKLNSKPQGEKEIGAWAMSLFVFAYRFVSEIEFSIGEIDIPEVGEIHEFVIEHIDEFPGSIRAKLLHAQTRMIGDIAGTLIRHPNIKKIHQMLDAVASADEQRSKTMRVYEEESERLNALEAKLREQAHGYNFVGLAQGFKTIAEKKEKERAMAFDSLRVLGVAALVPVLGELLFVMFAGEYVKANVSVLLYTLPALITLEVILIYFFRVVLAHFRSVKAQILQLDLRMSLCQFIQSYASYAADLKEKSGTSLERFESVVFSGLLANEEQLPATFDGMEQLINAAKAIKG